MQCRSRVREHSLSQLGRPAPGPGVVKLFGPDSCQGPAPPDGYHVRRGRILVGWARHPYDGRPGHGEIYRKRPEKRDNWEEIMRDSEQSCRSIALTQSGAVRYFRRGARAPQCFFRRLTLDLCWKSMFLPSPGRSTRQQIESCCSQFCQYGPGGWSCSHAILLVAMKAVVQCC